jgi:hypothetical protein
VKVTISDATTPDTWDADGDVLTVRWNEPATHAGDADLSEAEVEAILGTSVDLGGATVTQDGDGTATWTLTVGGADLAEGVTLGDAANGTNNTDVTDAEANPQVPTTGETVGTRPAILAARLVATDGTTNATWDAVGDVLRIEWDKAVTHAGDATIDETELEAILGTSVAFAGSTTVTQGGDGTATWTLTIGDAAMTEGVAEDDDTNGTSNANVTDGDGNDQTEAPGVTLGVGPRISEVELTSSDGATPNTWDAVGDVLTITWNEVATHAGSTAIDEAELEAILGTSVAFAGSTTVTQAGDGTATWTLTIGGAAMSEGVAATDAVNGTNNADVNDAETNPQVPTAGETVGDGTSPKITVTSLTTSVDGDASWDAVGEVLTVTWNEAATHAGTTAIDEAELEAILGTTVTFGLSPATTVTQGGDGTATWTLTISGGALLEAVAEGDATNGTANANVTDASGNTQMTTTGVALGIGPRITATRITTTDGAANSTWSADGDVLTIAWNEAATHTGDADLSEAEVEAVLGTGVVYGGASTVTLAGNGTVTWTLTIGGEALADGVSEGDDTNGTNDADVTDTGSHPQLATTAETLGVGPRITEVKLTASDGATANTWDAVGDVLTVTWNEAATHTGSTAIDEAELEAILGTPVAFAGSTTVTQGGDGTATWTLTIGGAAMSEGVAVDDSANGTNNANVLDAGSNPQVPTTGEVVVDGAGPKIVDASLTADADADSAWDAVGDVIRITWSEAATHTGDTAIDEAELEAILGTTVTFGLSPATTVTLGGNGTATWTLTIGASAMVDGVAVGDGTNGTGNANVKDGANNNQVATTGETLGIGPKITATRLTTSADGDATWDADGEVLTITWSEAATHAGTTAIDEAELEAILGTLVDLGGATVTQDGDGTATWTLTIGTAAMAEGVAGGEDTNGSNNANVTDATGNTQLATTGETLGVGPQISEVKLTASDGSTPNTWDAVGDVLTVTWNEAASHAGDTAISEAELEAILGRSVTLGGSTTVTQGGDGTATWTLTIGTAAMTVGVAVDDAANGTNNANVLDTGSNPQVPTTGEVVVDGTGPKITVTRLTGSVDGDTSWDAVGDVLTIVWSEAATHSDADTTLEATQVNAVLGTSLVGPLTFATLGGEGTATWTLTIANAPFTVGLAEGVATNGTANAAVTDVPAGNSQTTSSGVTFGVGPRITASSLTATDGQATPTWDAVGDVLTITWNEAATHAGNTDLSEAEVEAILGRSVTFGGLTTVTQTNDGTSTWTLTIGGAAMTEGVAAGDDTNGTNNADVTDAAGNPQVPTTGETVGVGPRISETALTIGGADVTVWNQVGDQITITWTEAASHFGDANLSEAEVEAILGVDITFGGSTVVTQSGDGTSTWTLTIANESLAAGVATGDPTNGSNNAAVTDGEGNPEVTTTGETL